MAHYRYLEKERLIELAAKHLKTQRALSSRLDNAIRKIQRLQNENALLKAKSEELPIRALIKMAALEDELQEYKALVFLKSLDDNERKLLRKKVSVDNSLADLKSLVKLE